VCEAGLTGGVASVALAIHIGTAHWKEHRARLAGAG